MTGRQIFSEAERLCLQELVIKYKLNSLKANDAGTISRKKHSWKSLTAEFNSYESNQKRTESQLKKCWDNLKTRKKLALDLENPERIKTEEGLCVPVQSSSQLDVLDDSIVQPDVELQYDSDTPNSNVYSAEASQGFGMSPARETQETSDTDQHTRRSPGYRLPEDGFSAGRNIRSRVNIDNFNLRRAAYQRTQSREDEIHKLRIEERKFLVLAAEEKYKMNALK